MSAVKENFRVRELELNFTQNFQGGEKPHTGPKGIEAEINFQFEEGYVLDRQFTYGMGHDPGYNAQVRVVLIFRHWTVRIEPEGINGYPLKAAV